MPTLRYGDRQSFMQVFHPDRLIAYTQDIERCFFGSAPSLHAVNAAYGAGTAEAWLVTQIEKVASFCGVRDKAEQQTAELASLIAAEYTYMTVAELMLFFRRLMSGRYGRFYGSIDPLLIMQSLRTFADERSEAIARHEAEQAVARHKAWLNNEKAITYEQYLLQHDTTRD